jgi:predicted AAA+ superfamily ATPase
MEWKEGTIAGGIVEQSPRMIDPRKKEPKYYFYDTGQVSGDEGSKLETLVACALLKELHFLEDTETGFNSATVRG